MKFLVHGDNANDAKSANIKSRVSYIRGNCACKWKIKFYNDECTIPVSHYTCEN